MNIHGYQIDENSQSIAAQGFLYQGEKGGKIYFMKQYLPAKPLEGQGSPKLYAKKLEAFEQRTFYRTKINQALRAIGPSADDMVMPEEEFVEQVFDESGKGYAYYWEATPVALDCLPVENAKSVLSQLTKKEQLMLLGRMAAAVGTLHLHGIVHSDLQPANLFLAKDAFGHFSVRLIDFDGSYFLNDKNTTIAGNEVYCSPELCLFSQAEREEDEEYREKLTEKSDIFSLGLIYHFYLSGGELPEAMGLPESLQQRQDKGYPVYPSIVILSGGTLVISDKITSPKLRALIESMLSQAPEERPSAEQVLRSLTDAM